MFSEALREERIVSANRWAPFHIVLPGVDDLVEVFLAAEDAAAEPDGEALHHVLGDVDLDGLGHGPGGGLVLLQAVVDALLDLLVQALVEVLEEGAAA